MLQLHQLPPKLAAPANTLKPWPLERTTSSCCLPIHKLEVYLLLFETKKRFTFTLVFNLIKLILKDKRRLCFLLGSYYKTVQCFSTQFYLMMRRLVEEALNLLPTQPCKVVTFSGAEYPGV